MATHSSVLAWRIPGTGEPGGLLSMGLHRVGTQLKRLRASQVELAVKQTNTCLQCSRFKRRRFNPWVGKIPWRRAWQFTPVFLPGESHGQRSLVGYSPWGCKESDSTEVIEHEQEQKKINGYFFVILKLTCNSSSTLLFC